MALSVLVSCEHGDMDSATRNCRITYSVNVPATASVRSTDSNAGGGTISNASYVNQLVYAVYRVTGATGETAATAQLQPENLVYQSTVAIAPNSQDISVPLELVNGQSYVVLFWAQVEDKWFNGKSYMFGTSGVTYPNYPENPENNYVPNSEDYIAFAGADYISFNGYVNRNITLVRPFAQLNLATNIPPTEQEPNINIVGTSVKVEGAAATYDVAKGKGIISEVAEENILEFASAAPIGPQTPDGQAFPGYDAYLSMNYIFLAEESAKIKVSYEIVTESHGTVKNSITNVPAARNYKTNIVGNLLSGKINYDQN